MYIESFLDFHVILFNDPQKKLATVSSEWSNILLWENIVPSPLWIS